MLVFLAGTGTECSCALPAGRSAGSQGGHAGRALWRLKFLHNFDVKTWIHAQKMPSMLSSSKSCPFTNVTTWCAGGPCRPTQVQPAPPPEGFWDASVSAGVTGARLWGPHVADCHSVLSTQTHASVGGPCLITTGFSFQFYGPRIGALYVRGLSERTPLHPMLFGGGQERTFRPG